MTSKHMKLDGIILGYREGQDLSHKYGQKEEVGPAGKAEKWLRIQNEYQKL